jgi:UDP:flavonoid glycosyltransferase YjiC (YdhE family)
VDVLYEGLKRIKCRVIWCLRGKEFHHSDNTDFKVGPWWPQAEILAHKATRVGISHCGFGGCLEFLAAGIPMATFAHFGDQTGNEACIVSRGYGIKLNKRNLFFGLERFTFVRP